MQFTSSAVVWLSVLLSSTTYVLADAEPPSVIGELIEETGFYQSIRLAKENPVLYKKQSQYQAVEVLQSQSYGKILVLDGVVQLTERDADSYNEMMTHVPMFQHVEPKHVLIIGGGDGYVLSEVLKHNSVVHVDHVDLDGDVISVCKTYFNWGSAWDDDRVTLHVADGAAFVRDQPSNSYDIIIQDSSDPWAHDSNGQRVELPSAVLYSPEHFRNIHRILKPDGILNLQAETIQIPSDLTGIREWHQLALSIGFDTARYGSLVISSYPTGQIGFLLCEKNHAGAASVKSIEKRYKYGSMKTSYYHPPLQSSAFVLPLWAQKHIYDNASDGKEEL